MGSKRNNSARTNPKRVFVVAQNDGWRYVTIHLNIVSIVSYRNIDCNVAAAFLPAMNKRSVMCRISSINISLLYYNRSVRSVVALRPGLRLFRRSGDQGHRHAEVLA